MKIGYFLVAKILFTIKLKAACNVTNARIIYQRIKPMWLWVKKNNFYHIDI